MKVNTSELTGVALDWAVATAEGYTNLRWNNPRGGYAPWLIMDAPRLEWGPVDLSDLRFSIDWEHGGPIIEREKIGLWDSADAEHQGEWAAATVEWMSMDVESDEFLNSLMPYHGPTPLIAAMRCYVASKLGDEVDVPRELV